MKSINEAIIDDITSKFDWSEWGPLTLGDLRDPLIKALDEKDKRIIGFIQATADKIKALEEEVGKLKNKNIKLL